MTKLDDLLGLGFAQLPGFDATYFDTRINNGFFLLVSPTHKQYYALYTINAKECVRAMKSILDGRTRNRAILLQNALRASSEEDWDIYFRPGEHSNKLRPRVNKILTGFSEIKQGHARLDPNELIDLWYVEFKNGYGLYIIGHEMDAEKAIYSFVREWRRRLDNAERGGSVNLLNYYKATGHLAEATSNWVHRNLENFTAHRVDGLAGKTRSEVKKQTVSLNRARTIAYNQSLNNVPSTPKRYIDLEGTFQ